MGYRYVAFKKVWDIYRQEPHPLTSLERLQRFQKNFSPKEAQLIEERMNLLKEKDLPIDDSQVRFHEEIIYTLEEPNIPTSLDESSKDLLKDLLDEKGLKEEKAPILLEPELENLLSALKYDNKMRFCDLKRLCLLCGAQLESNKIKFLDPPVLFQFHRFHQGRDEGIVLSFTGKRNYWKKLKQMIQQVIGSPTWNAV